MLTVTRSQLQKMADEAEKVFIRTEITKGLWVRVEVQPSAVKKMLEEVGWRIGDRLIVQVIDKPELVDVEVSSYNFVIGRRRSLKGKRRASS